MTQAQGRLQNAVAPRFTVERFQDFAYAELQVSSPWVHGVCFHPPCQRRFTPARSWQMYCCGACQTAAKVEMRTWGHRMALPLLIHRIGKYNITDQGVMDTTRAARRYVTQVQSAWLADRIEKAKGTEHARS